MKYILLLISLIFIISCSSSKFRDYPLKEHQTDTGYKYKQFGLYYYGGQPSAMDLIKLRQDGFVAVVNFRKHKEDGIYNEKLERNNSLLSGMSYINIPYDPKENEIDGTFINKYSRELSEEYLKGKVLLHCASGNRAAMWISANAYLNQKATRDQVFELSKKLGVKGLPLKHLKAFAK